MKEHPIRKKGVDEIEAREYIDGWQNMINFQ